jgi:hypothetical protein
MSGLWHQVPDTAAPAGDPSLSPNAWYYGLDPSLNYDTGARTFGSLISPVYYNLASDAALSFLSWAQTEDSPSVDLRNVYISINGGASWTLLQNMSGNENSWIQAVIGLSAYAGHDAMFRFEFDSVDAYANDFRGWYVDDVGLVQATSTVTPTKTVSPTAAATATASPTGTQASFATMTATMPQFTATPSMTMTPVPQATKLSFGILNPEVYPNPFNPASGGYLWAKYLLSQDVSGVSLKVYTNSFRLVRVITLSGQDLNGCGTRVSKIDAGKFSGLSSGTYYYFIEARSAGGEVRRSQAEVVLIIK